MKKKYRIKKETEFRSILHLKQSFANKHLIVYIRRKEQKHFRVGLSVGKKVGNAVMRNRVKRLLRQSLQELTDVIQSDIDIILIARPAISQLSYSDVKKNVQHVLNLANVIKRTNERDLRSEK